MILRSADLNISERLFHLVIEASLCKVLDLEACLCKPGEDILWHMGRLRLARLALELFKDS